MTNFPKAPQTLSGSVLTVLLQLLAEGDHDAVVALFNKLNQHNTDLQRRLASLLYKSKTREGVSIAQLHLLFAALAPSSAEPATGAQSSDARATADQTLRAVAPEKKEEAAAKKPRPQPPMRRTLSDKLRRVENEIPVPQDQRHCPACGQERTCIGHEVTEVIDLIPTEVIVRRDRREKLCCKSCEGQLVRAPLGDKVVSGGRMGTRLVSELLVNKYSDGLPLHRQKERLAHLGLPLPISTLVDQITWATDLLRPLWRCTMEQVLGAHVMHVDSTGLLVLDKTQAQGKKLGVLWGYVGDNNTALYLYAKSGHKIVTGEDQFGPENFLARRKGLTVADAATVFDASFKRDDLIECGCNMHARRYFIKALERGDQRAALPLGAYKALYQIEEELKGLSDSDKTQGRQQKSRPVYDKLLAWAKAHQPHEPPAGPMGKAIGYLLNHHLALMRFLDDGKIPIDNGAVERLHVRTAITRKNFLFVGSDAGAVRAAIAYTLLASCRLVAINPFDYLADVLPRLSRGIRLADAPSLLPAAFKSAAH